MRLPKLPKLKKVKLNTSILGLVGPITLVTVLMKMDLGLLAYGSMLVMGLFLCTVEILKLTSISRARRVILDDQLVNWLYVGWGICAAVRFGSPVESVILVVVLPWLLDKYGKDWALVVDAILSVMLIMWILIKPLMP